MRTHILALICFVITPAFGAGVPAPAQPTGPAHTCEAPQNFEGGIKAKTIVAFRISPDGSVTDAKVTGSSGSSTLDEAAMACVGTWHYIPAMLDGHPVETFHEAGVSWSIEQLDPAAPKNAPHACGDYVRTPDESEVQSPATFEFFVGPDGKLHDVAYFSSGDPAFDAAMLRCVSGWVYIPSTRDGAPVSADWGATLALKIDSSVQVSEGSKRRHACARAYYIEKFASPTAEGSALVRFEISSLGDVESPSILQSSGNDGLDRASMACVKRWSYLPAKVNGKAVPVYWSAEILWSAKGNVVREVGRVP